MPGAGEVNRPDEEILPLRVGSEEPVHFGVNRTRLSLLRLPPPGNILRQPAPLDIGLRPHPLVELRRTEGLIGFLTRKEHPHFPGTELGDEIAEGLGFWTRIEIRRNHFKV